MNSSVTSTCAVRAGIDTDCTHGAVIPPLYLSTNFSLEDIDRKRPYDYTRSGNPTRHELANALTELECGAGTVVVSSGMAAASLALELVPTGGRVIAAHDCYGGTWRLLNAWARKGRFNVDFIDFSNPLALAEVLENKPDLLWVETPSNPLLRITDIQHVAQAAHAAGALCLVDNTFLSPCLQQPLTLGADLVLHSTTKYINGHSDVVGGALVAGNDELAEKIAWWGNCNGLTGAPFDSFLTLRGLRSLHARMQQHQANATRIATFLDAHPAVLKVNFPGLASHPGHELAARQQKGFGAMLSFEIDGGIDVIRPFVKSLKYFTLAESLGGVESLIEYPATMTHAAMTPEARRQAGISDGLVRLSIGIEDGDDLLADLETALNLGRSTSATYVDIAQ